MYIFNMHEEKKKWNDCAVNFFLTKKREKRKTFTVNVEPLFFSFFSGLCLFFVSMLFISFRFTQNLVFSTVQLFPHTTNKILYLFLFTILCQFIFFCGYNFSFSLIFIKINSSYSNLKYRIFLKKWYTMQ